MRKTDIYNPTYLMPETIMVIFQSIDKRLPELHVINAAHLPNGIKSVLSMILCKPGTTYPKSVLWSQRKVAKRRDTT